MLPPAGRREPCRLIRVAGAMGERRPRRASLLHRLVFSRQQADPHRELSRTRRGPRSRRAVGVPTAQRRRSGNALETADRSNTRGRWFETSRAHRPDGRRGWFLHTTRIPTRSKPAAPIVRMAAGAGFFTPLASLLVRNQPRPSLFLLASRAFAALGVGRPSCASHASRPAPRRSLPEPAGAAASDARIDWSLSR
jgi:hypothetical protein